MRTIEAVAIDVAQNYLSGWNRGGLAGRGPIQRRCSLPPLAVWWYAFLIISLDTPAHTINSFTVYVRSLTILAPNTMDFPTRTGYQK